MFRKRGSKSSGSSFDNATIESVWRKGVLVSADRRKDDCGATMQRSEYGNTDSKLGWEIDHLKPVALGGSDDLNNLRPLQWENNRSKGDDYPRYTCTVKI